ncbi:hypothetical protein FrEUN1fDRAFT_0343 [Parafrankia sp. EUN1f]|nr:hypothetical protein FrEUN1fDRAFT_0343 [Parafrankia sp. EUN1f]
MADSESQDEKPKRVRSRVAPWDGYAEHIQWLAENKPDELPPIEADRLRAEQDKI